MAQWNLKPLGNIHTWGWGDWSSLTGVPRYKIPDYGCSEQSKGEQKSPVSAALQTTAWPLGLL